jgi:hypothetical protein
MIAMERIMKKEFQKIQNVLIELFNAQKHLVHSGEVTEGYWELQDLFPPMENQDQIKDLMDIKTGKMKTNFLESDQFLYFPPIPNHPKTLIIFSMDYDFHITSDNISFYIIVFHYSNDVKQDPSYLGFRFEGPEGTPSTTSRHNYWHMQIVKEFKGRHAAKFPKIHKWLPEDMPCIPMKANSAITLLICLLFSFYGNPLFNEIDVALEEEHKKPLDGILCIEGKKSKKKIKK